MDCAGLVVPITWFPKVKLVADKVALGPELTPVPFREIECGLPTLLSVILMEVLRGPNWLGVKVTLMGQSAPAARLGPHEPLWLKSAALVPVIERPVITSSEPPVLVSV